MNKPRRPFIDPIDCGSRIGQLEQQLKIAIEALERIRSKELLMIRSGSTISEEHYYEVARIALTEIKELENEHR